MLSKPLLIPKEFICLRDEFTCPITRELLRDPWLASDGHSYERDAIEHWLLSKGTSPKTGQPLESISLFPNHNLKRLIKDLINEGGTGLYLRDESGHGDIANDDVSDDFPCRFALVPQQVLVLKCLGPTESDWNMKSFRVSENGCMGGRKRPHNLGSMDFMNFNDATVSRTHFLIYFDREVQRRFFIKDCCSAGGTYLRIAYGVPKPLYRGLMIMLGKHQLLVQSTNDEDNESSTVPLGIGFNASQGETMKDSCCPTTPTTSNSGGAAREGESRRPTDDWATNQPQPGEAGLRLQGESCPLSAGGEDDVSVPETPLHDKNESCFENEEVDVEEEEANRSIVRTTLNKETARAQGRDTIALQCFAPEGTPIQGETYLISREGATLGRKQLNTIAFSHIVKDQLMGIDSSISGEHARVVWSKEDQCFQLFDGTETKPSTNGTWFRLSSMYSNSEPCCLWNGMEILIGTIRFSVSLEQVIVEEDASNYKGRHSLIHGKT